MFFSPQAHQTAFRSLDSSDPFLDSRLVHVQFFLPKHSFTSSYLDNQGLRVNVSFAGKLSRALPPWINTLTSALRVCWANPHHSTNHTILKSPLYSCLPWISQSLKAGSMSSQLFYLLCLRSERMSRFLWNEFSNLGIFLGHFMYHFWFTQEVVLNTFLLNSTDPTR